jgi:hypothetical protein
MNVSGICRAPWSWDRSTARPLLTRGNRNTETHIHVPSGIRTNDQRQNDRKSMCQSSQSLKSTYGNTVVIHVHRWYLLVLAHCRTTTQFLMIMETLFQVLRHSGRFVTQNFSDHFYQIGIIRMTHCIVFIYWDLGIWFSMWTYERFVLQMLSFRINLMIILFFCNAPGHVQSLYDLSENIKS